MKRGYLTKQNPMPVPYTDTPIVDVRVQALDAYESWLLYTESTQRAACK
jgi:hypothetical protein